MHPELQETLDAYRQSRNFDPLTYLQAKCALLNLYFSQSGIETCVIGLSGGVDSAATAALLVHASRLPGSPLKRIVPLLKPTHSQGATQEDVVNARGAEVCKFLGIAPVETDLKSTLQATWEASRAGDGISGSLWAIGQLVSYTRRRLFSYGAVLAGEEELSCMLCGATNRDDGSYIGLFDEVSDGEVNLQPISDLHKSEVYKLAALLGLPESMLKATSIDDTYDDLREEEMIDISYKFLELYEWWLCEENRESWLRTLSAEALGEFERLAEKVESLHQRNKHKYTEESTTLHIDVLSRAVPAGWRHQELGEPLAIFPTAALKARVGPVELPDDIFRVKPSSIDRKVCADPILDFGNSAVLVKHALPAEICSKLLSESRKWTWVGTDKHGQPVLDSTEEFKAAACSYRATTYDEGFANQLWHRLSPCLPSFRVMTELTPTDHNGYPVWKPIGVNPMLRFIRYEEGGNIVPHYDPGFDFQNGRHYTLMSVVISLADSADGGTRFLLDIQRGIPIEERNFNDYEDSTGDEDVLYSFPGRKGDALIFDHQILHDAAIWHNTGSRVILQTDIIFERCASHAIYWFNSNGQSADFPEERWGNKTTYRNAHPVTGGEINQAGYFDSYLDKFIQFMPKVRTSPLQKLFQNLSKAPVSAPLAVLVTTGGMCPLHKGHINMMQEAKIAVEKTGKTVLAGFIAPDHDSYVLLKCGATALSIGQRLYLAEEAISGSDWLCIDHWAGYYTPEIMQFLTIKDRFGAQLASQVPIARPIEIIYVCGGDNALFSLNFTKRGSCVVVSRPGYDSKLESIKSHTTIKNNRRIMFAEDNMSAAASSKIRKGNFEELPESVVGKYKRMRDGQKMPVQQPHLNGEINFYMRHEGSWAVSHWADRFGLDASILSRAYATFCEALVKVFQSAFDKERRATGGPKVHIIPLHLANQTKAFQQLKEGRYSNSTIVSLDPCLPSAQNFAITRCFEPVSVSEDCEFVARPGQETLENQADQLLKATQTDHADQKIILFDHENFTGKTFLTVKSLLEARDPKYKIDEFVTLSDSVSGPDSDLLHERPRLNLVNCRDFLAGSREGGLVVRIRRGEFHESAQEVYRVPCVLPFVRPTYRASVPMDQELEFSRQVRELNLKFMEDAGLVKEDMQSGFASLLHDWILGPGEHLYW